jgi:Flp pilus assembly protein TadG
MPRARPPALLPAWRRRARQLPGGGERGSLSVFVVLFAVTVVLLAGLVVDGGMAISKRERAADIAEQAARRVADDIDEEELRQGNVVVRDGACARAGELAAAMDEGTITGCNVAGNEATVAVRIRYAPALLGLIMNGSFVANASATARPAVGITGEGT